MAKTEIVIYAWHLFESSGGFEWGPATPANLAALRTAFDEDMESGEHTSASLSTLAVAGFEDSAESWNLITDFLDGEIQDAVETGRVGHILVRYNLEP